MSSKGKDKGAFAPEAKECANCLAPDGRHGVTLKACTRCKATALLWAGLSDRALERGACQVLRGPQGANAVASIL